jgi:tetratricopeptide (TPR) repeat protein
MVAIFRQRNCWLSFWCFAVWQCSSAANNDGEHVINQEQDELVCKEITAGDGSTEVSCHFRLKHIPAYPVIELNSCAQEQQQIGNAAGDDDDNNNYCVSASISIRPNEFKRIRNDGNDESSSETSSTNPDSDDDVDPTSSTPPPLPEEQILEVGVATYQKPYSQYGTEVAAVLLRYPHKDKNDASALANWYLELGMTHFPREDDDDNHHNRAYDWYSYSLQLTLNALRLAVSVFGGDVDNSVERKVFVASVHYSLGEAYFIDPELGHMTEALEAYQKAYDLYENLLEVDPLQKQQIWDIPDTERRYADVCTKLGMSMIQTMDPMMMMMNDPMNTLMMNMNDDAQEGLQEAQTRLVSDDDGNYNNTKDSDSPFAKAQSMFSKSSSIFERLLRHELTSQQAPDQDWFVVDLRMGLSLALQQSATTGVLMADPHYLRDALEKFQYAIRLQKTEILPHLEVNGAQHVNAKTTLADLYISLADAALQAGSYDLAKEAYGNAMTLHDQHNIAVAPLPPMSEQNEQALEDHLQLLREYRGMVNNGGGGQQHPQQQQKLYPKGNDDYDDAAYHYYERNDGYEGDMMTNIGALYMAKGETEAAISYLEQALIKYQDETDGQAMADLKLNLAMVYYRVRRFHDSQRVHLDALSAYQQLYGDGVNPFVQMLDRYEDMIQQQQQQGIQQQQQPPPPPRPKEEGTTKDRTGDSTGAKVIDLDQYRSSIKNATASASATVKAEL